MPKAATLEAPAPIGHNAPPNPFEAHRINIEDLYGEAKNWLDGTAIADATEADAVETLLDMLRDGRKAADDARKAENEPFDKGKAEVQARYTPLLKRADTAAEGCKAVLSVWRQALAAEKARIAEAARLEAEAKARGAAKMRAAIDPGDLSALEAADAVNDDAEAAAKAAVKASRDTVKGLRTYHTAVLTDGVAAARHYWATQREACEAFFLSLAKTDVLHGKRQIPGFDVTEEKRAF